MGGRDETDYVACSKGDQEAHSLNKVTLAAKLFSNQKVRRGAVELLKDSSFRRVHLEQARQPLLRR